MALVKNNGIKLQVNTGEEKVAKVPVSTIGLIQKRFSTAKTSIATLVSNKTTALY